MVLSFFCSKNENPCDLPSPINIVLKGAEVAAETCQNAEASVKILFQKRPQKPLD